MDSKYYTPDMSEFHVGFEYDEFWNDKPREFPNGYWKNKSADNFDLLHCIPKRIERGDFRVKFLDEKDIQELGWVEINDNVIRMGEKPLNVFENERGYSLSNYGNGCVRIYAPNKFILFFGKIKNKSGLKRVMSMLGII